MSRINPFNGPDVSDGTDAEGFPGGDVRIQSETREGIFVAPLEQDRRKMQREDVCLWPNGDWCLAEDLEEYLQSHSDDYEVVNWDSFLGAHIDGRLEEGCKALFDHEFWQVLNDTNTQKLKDYLGLVS